MTYYKILARGRRACHGGTYRYTPNRWTRRITNTDACRRGWHVCTEAQLARWLYADSDDQLPLEVWECDVDNPTDAGDKFVCERIRLTRLVGKLDEYDLRWLGTEFAISVLHNTDDPRVGECINTVRAYCCGMADEDDLQSARVAAGAAAGAAARAAARAASWAASWAAAWAAARDAARAAAWAASWAAAWAAARDAAWAAARDAARDAARAASWARFSRMVLNYLTEEAS